MAKNSNTLFGASRSAVTKNIISSESVDNIYGAATAENQVKFAYGEIKSAGSSEKSNVSGQINFGRDTQGNFGAIFVGHDLVSSKILDISVGNTVDGFSVVTVKFVDMTQGNGIGTLTFKAEDGAVNLLRTELIGDAQVTGKDVTIKGALHAAEEAQKTADAAVVSNEAITPGTHTKITYDSKGLVTGGADLTAADIPSIEHSKISDWNTELAKKQDVLVFNTAYNAETNKVATMADIGDLSGAMHFLGTVDSAPSSGTITIDDKPVIAKAGDIVIVPNTSKEYLYNGSAWLELGDEVLYAKKADTISATNADNGVAVTLGGTVSAPTLAVAVTDGAVAQNNTSVVLGGTVYASIEDAKGDVIGNAASDTSTSKTIEGTRKYVDAVVAGKNVGATVAEGETLVSASASNNTVTVGSTEALKTAVTNANSAVQSIKVGTQTINKTNGAVALDTLKTDLGLGSAAYKDAASFDVAGAASTVKNEVVGGENDASTDLTLHGLKKAIEGKNVGATVAENETLVTASASSNIVTVGSTDALKTAVEKANSAVQKLTILGHEIGNGGSVTVEQAKTDLGLGSAAYESSTAFDAAGSASAVLGKPGDASTANTVFGAKKYTDSAKTEVLGNAASDTSTSKTIEGTRKYAESLVSGGLTWIMLD